MENLDAEYKKSMVQILQVANRELLDALNDKLPEDISKKIVEVVYRIDKIILTLGPDGNYNAPFGGLIS